MTAELIDPGLERPDVVAVADHMSALLRSFGRARSRLLAAAEHDVEWSANLVLKCIAGNDGPMRASALAESLRSDPSTVSRQVAALVKDGLLERRADPADGRASLLALTPKADAVLADHDSIRRQYFAHVLDGWNDTDLRRFATLLARFTSAFESTSNEWMSEQVAARAARGARSAH